MFRKISIIGALVVAIVVSLVVLAPQSASTGKLADRVSASVQVPEKGDVPLSKSSVVGTFSNIEVQLKTRQRLTSAYNALIDKRADDRVADEKAADDRYADAYVAPVSPPVSYGYYSYGQLEALWVSAGGPSWAESTAAAIALCESQGNPYAYNGSGASGLWQILGQVVAGDIYNPFVNAENAISKFNSSGWFPWNASIGCWGGSSQAAIIAKPLSVNSHLLGYSAKILTHSRQHPVRKDRRIDAYEWAWHHARGCWYAWGGASCQPGFDCSGLVMRAYEAVHIGLPHNTQLMVDSGKLVHVRDRYARKGDIVMYFDSSGAFHTGLVAYKTKWMLDASVPGVRVKVQRIWGDPEFYRVVRKS